MPYTDKDSLDWVLDIVRWGTTNQLQHRRTTTSQANDEVIVHSLDIGMTMDKLLVTVPLLSLAHNDHVDEQSHEHHQTSRDVCDRNKTEEYAAQLLARPLVVQYEGSSAVNTNTLSFVMQQKSRTMSSNGWMSSKISTSLGEQMGSNVAESFKTLVDCRTRTYVGHILLLRGAATVMDKKNNWTFQEFGQPCHETNDRKSSCDDDGEIMHSLDLVLHRFIQTVKSLTMDTCVLDFELISDDEEFLKMDDYDVEADDKQYATAETMTQYGRKPRCELGEGRSLSLPLRISVSMLLSLRNFSSGSLRQSTFTFECAGQIKATNNDGIHNVTLSMDTHQLLAKLIEVASQVVDLAIDVAHASDKDPVDGVRTIIRSGSAADMPPPPSRVMMHSSSCSKHVKVGVCNDISCSSNIGLDLLSTTASKLAIVSPDTSGLVLPSPPQWMPKLTLDKSSSASSWDGLPRALSSPLSSIDDINNDISNFSVDQCLDIIDHVFDELDDAIFFNSTPARKKFRSGE